jgi:hypothetical protein
MHPLNNLAHAKAVASFIDQEAQEQRWPENVPVNKETLEAVAQTHDIHIESSYFPTLDPDEYDWRTTGSPRDRKDGYRGRTVNDSNMVPTVRDLTTWHPYCKRALALYEMYLFGPDYYMTLDPVELPQTEDEFWNQYDLIMLAEGVWTRFLEANQTSFSVSEMVRRAYRDGDMFLHVDKTQWPWKVRFYDTEEIGESAGQGDEGIITADDDVTNIKAYRRIDADSKSIVREIPANEMYHVKVDADTNQRRGKSRFASAITIARILEGFTITESTHRQIQASIVIRRRVEGGGAATKLALNNSRTRQTSDGVSLDRLKAGTTIYEPRGITTEFVQPKSDFSDASPLAAFLIRHLAASTGWSYSMIAQDSGQGNLASEQLAEGPVKQMVRFERSLFASVLVDLFKQLITAAAAKNELGSGYRGSSVFVDYTPKFSFGTDMEREALKVAQANNLLYMDNAASARDLCEMSGKNWYKTLARILSERKLGIFPPSYQMPSNDDRKDSSSDNATDGSGTNQGK